MDRVTRIPSSLGLSPVPAVLVNGVFESTAIWKPLLTKLHRTDVVLLPPPGFGAPLPDDFDCTMQSYTQWLIREVEALGEPADLVGHDLGGAAVAGVAMARPDLVRSWVSDALSVFDPAYARHGLAQVFQTPGDGEKLVEDWMGGTLNERTKRMAERGISRKVAKWLAAAQGPEMRSAVLACYRSAVQPVMAELGRALPSAAEQPGLAMIPTEDEFAGPMEMRLRSAVRAGASVEILVGLGHWWMDQGPVRSARALNSFWAETRVLVH